MNFNFNFIDRGAQTLKEMAEVLSKALVLSSGDFTKKDTALMVIDMINGFAREGALKSERVENLISPVLQLMEKFRDFPILVFADSHPADSPEFNSYPLHCLEGSSESEVVEELKNKAPYQLIKKNSTNGFLTTAFQSWLTANPQIKNFIVVGDCTDICINQFAVTLKAFFNERNEASRVIVPINAVDTFDLGIHNADVMNVVLLCSMRDNGVEVVAEIK